MFITDVYFMSPNAAILNSLVFNLARGFLPLTRLLQLVSLKAHHVTINLFRLIRVT